MLPQLRFKQNRLLGEARVQTCPLFSNSGPLWSLVTNKGSRQSDLNFWKLSMQLDLQKTAEIAFWKHNVYDFVLTNLSYSTSFGRPANIHLWLSQEVSFGDESSGNRKDRGLKRLRLENRCSASSRKIRTALQSSCSRKRTHQYVNQPEVDPTWLRGLD